MAIFDSAIFDGPPGSTIFDTGTAIPKAREPPIAQAVVHDTQGTARLTN